MLIGEENNSNYLNDLNKYTYTYKNTRNNILNKITEIKKKENLNKFETLGKLNELNTNKNNEEDFSKYKSPFKFQYLNTGKLKTKLLIRY